MDLRGSGGHPDRSPSGTARPQSADVQGQSEATLGETGVLRFISPLKRWILWFLAFFGIYASSSVCPFCGTPGCPVGAGGAVLVGGLFAGLWQYGANVFRRFKELAKKLF